MSLEHFGYVYIVIERQNDMCGICFETQNKGGKGGGDLACRCDKLIHNLILIDTHGCIHLLLSLLENFHNKMLF